MNFAEISFQFNITKTELLDLQSQLIKIWERDPTKPISSGIDHLYEKFNKVLVQKFVSVLQSHNILNYGILNVNVDGSRSSNSLPKIIIIGAGLSGLISAVVLKQRGFSDIAILEARDRIGGRFATYAHRVFSTDLGCNYFEISSSDRDPNPLLVLCKQIGVEIKEINTKCPLFEGRVTKVPKDKCQTMEQSVSQMLNTVQELSNEYQKVSKNCFDEISDGTTKIKTNLPIGHALELLLMAKEKFAREKQIVFLAEKISYQKQLSHYIQEIKTEQKQLKNKIDRIDPFTTKNCDFERELGECTGQRSNISLTDTHNLQDELSNKEILESKLKYMEDHEPCDFFLSFRDRNLLDWHMANIEYQQSAPLDNLSISLCDTIVCKHDSNTAVFPKYTTVGQGLSSIPYSLAKDLDIHYRTAVSNIRFKEGLGKIVVNCHDATELLKRDSQYMAQFRETHNNGNCVKYNNLDLPKVNSCFNMSNNSQTNTLIKQSNYNINEESNETKHFQIFTGSSKRFSSPSHLLPATLEKTSNQTINKEQSTTSNAKLLTPLMATSDIPTSSTIFTTTISSCYLSDDTHTTTNALYDAHNSLTFLSTTDLAMQSHEPFSKTFNDMETSTTNKKNSTKNSTSPDSSSSNKPLNFEADIVICTLPLGVLKESIDSQQGSLNASHIFDISADNGVMENSETKKINNIDTFFHKLNDSQDLVGSNAKYNKKYAPFYLRINSNIITFDPPLPISKNGAIRRLGFGLTNKLIMYFEKRFWDEDIDMFGYVGNSTPESRGEFFLFQSFNNANGASTGGATLSAIISGLAATVLEKVADEILIERCITILKRIFGMDNVPSPKETVVTRWDADIWAKGASTYITPDSSSDDIDILSEPITFTNHAQPKIASKNCHLLFAGEHTSREHYGTAQGALLSGLREASRILQIYDN